MRVVFDLWLRNELRTSTSCAYLNSSCVSCYTFVTSKHKRTA